MPVPFFQPPRLPLASKAACVPAPHQPDAAPPGHLLPSSFGGADAWWHVGLVLSRSSATAAATTAAASNARGGGDGGGFVVVKLNTGRYEAKAKAKPPMTLPPSFGSSMLIDHMIRTASITSRTSPMSAPPKSMPKPRAPSEPSRPPTAKNYQSYVNEVLARTDTELAIQRTKYFDLAASRPTTSN